MSECLPQLSLTTHGVCKDGAWTFNVQAMVTSQEAACTLIAILEIMKPLFAESTPPEPQSTPDGSEKP